MRRARRHPALSVAILCLLGIVIVNSSPHGTPPERRSSDRLPDSGALSSRVLSILTTALAGPSALAAMAGLAAEGSPCDAPANEIVAENCLAGEPPSTWMIFGSGAPSIQGFTTDISVNQGDTVFFKINTPSNNYRLDIYRLGYYGGNGARKVAVVQPSASLPQAQPLCFTEAATGLIDCGNWAISASWVVPANATSGLYFARAVREDDPSPDPDASHIYFIVRDDDGQSDLLFQTSDPTWQAYNNYGGNSLYSGSPAGRAFKVSYNRPLVTRSFSTPNSVFNAEYPMIRWLERNGYDVSYFTGVDSDRSGPEIQEHKIFLSVGHDEYWSKQQRLNVEAARDNGVHLAFFSGNEIFQKTRWENSSDGLNTSHRTLVTYKETQANAKIDPSPEWTGTWRDNRPFNPEGPQPENALTGTLFMVNNQYESRSIVVNDVEGKRRFWRNTSAAVLPQGQVLTLPLGTLGYEWDTDADNGARPPGLIRLSTATYSVPGHLKDNGATYAPGTETHHLTLYRKNNTYVFSAGTIQWSWGLDENHDLVGGPASADMKQATINLLIDMAAVLPATPEAGIVLSNPSTDVVAPTSVITAPTAGAQLPASSIATITGTASDVNGLVAGVEVSVDNGLTWHAATGTDNWTYTWTPTVPGPTVIKSRATDDSANAEIPGAGVNVTITPPNLECAPCTIWPDTSVPVFPSFVEDPDAIQLAVKFRSGVDGFITALRFYKGPTNTGTHVGHLWSANGTILSTVTFTGETASGWQRMDLPTPVPITANTTYLAGYHAPNGNYAVDPGYFAASGFTRGPLKALADGEDGPNSLYTYSPIPVLPNQAFGSHNYWIDIEFKTSLNNTAPVAVNDAYSTNEDTPLNVLTPGVRANDTDPDAGDTFTAVLVSSTTHGTLLLSPNGGFDYTPNANFNGTDSFTYKANDGEADSGLATVTITVASVGDAPVAVGDSYTTPEDVPLTVAAPGVLVNDSDIDSPTITAVLATNVAHGTLALNPNGSFTYTPAANFNGSDSFTYRASDGELLSSAVPVTIAVTAVNDSPVVDAGPDQSLTLPATASLVGMVLDEGPFTNVWGKVAGPGTVTFGNANATSTTATFSLPGAYILSLTAADGQFAVSDTMTVTVSPPNGALRFDGVNDYVTFGPAVGTATGLGATTFTLETWFKREGPGIATSTGTNGISALVPLIAKGAAQAEGSNVDANYILGIDATRRVLAADFEDTPSGANHPVFGTTPICDRIWYHAAATYDGTTWRLYLNGVLETQLTIGSFTPRSDSIQHAGLGTTLTSTGTAAGFFQGALDEARIWNVVRDASQIQSTMGAPLTGPASNVIGLWSLNEVAGPIAADSSGRNLNGTWTNGPLSITGSPFAHTPLPPGNYGLNLTGTAAAGDRVSFGPANGPTGLGAATFTIETWFKRTGAGVTANTGTGGVLAIPLVTKGMAEAEGSSVDMNYFLGIRGTDGVLVADFEDTATGGNHPVAGITAIPSDGAWRHAAATYDGTTWRLYLNGVLETTLVVGNLTPRADSIQHAGLGTAYTSTGAASGFFAGALDEVRIWNVARTTEQIAGSRNSEIVSAPGLRGRWSFNNTCGQVLDASGNNNNGTLFGTTWTWTTGAPLSVEGNLAPVPVAGDDQNITLPASAILLGSVTDDGLSGLPVVTTWSKTSGPGTVTFGNPNALSTTASFSVAGSYVLTLAANDGELTGIDTISIEVVGIANQPPVVDAGPDQALTLPINTASLLGVVTDDPLPGTGVTTQWSKVSGPGVVVFGNAAAASTTASFSLQGSYVLRLTGNDGALSASDTLTITVQDVTPNSALDLGGTNAFTTFGAAPGLGATLFTIETWFRRDGPGIATNTGSGGVIAVPLVTRGMAEVDNNNNRDMNYFLGIQESNNVLIADFEDMATGANHPVQGITPIPSDGQWHHAAATWDGTTWRLYLDGILDQQLVVGAFTARSDSIQHAAIGTALNSTGGVGSQTQGFFDGVIDEARIWNVVRTGSQINVGKNHEISSAPGLLARWGFNEGTGTSVADSSGRSINGTVTGTVWSWVMGAPFAIQGNTAPVATNDTASANSGVPLAIVVLANDSDADGDPLAVTAVTAPAHGTATINANGTITYTAAAGFGGADSFSYTITDGQGGSATATVGVGVSIVNAPPAVNAGPDQTITLPVNSVTLSGTAFDDGLSGLPVTSQWTKVSGPGVVTFASATALSTTATFSIQGVYVLQLTVSDGLLSGSDTISVTVNASAGNRALQLGGTNAYVTFGAAPSLGAAQFTTEVWFRRDGAGVATNTGTGGFTAIPLVTKGMAEAEGGPVDMNYFLGIRQSDGVLVADFEDTATGLNHPVAGTTAIPIDGAWRHAAATYDGTTWRVYLNGVLETTLAVGNFTPRADSIQHAALGTALNSTGGVGSIAQGFFAGVLDEARIWNYARSGQQISHGMVLEIPTSVPGLLARWGLNEGTGTVAGDSSGNARTGTVVGTNWSWVSGAPFLVAGNSPPNAVNDVATTPEETMVTISVLTNDTDADGDPVALTTVTAPAHGTAVANPNGTVTYTPAGNFSGPDAFTYTVIDTQGGSATGNVNVTVTIVNDPPVAVNDSYTVDEDATLTVDVPGVLANDTDPDEDVLMAIGLSAPAHGTLTFNADGDFTYAPNAGYSGPDSFTYLVNDGTVDSNIATVTITVNPVNDPPAAVADSYSTNEDVALTISAPGVLANDTDEESNPLTAALVAGPVNGAVTLNPDGSFTYTPALNFNGSDSFTYRANDGSSSSNIATVSITINPVNDAPVAVNESYSTNEDVALTVGAPGVLGNDTDIESNPLTAALVSGPSNGTLTLNPDGSFTYTPALNFNGSDSFTYKANDGGADSNTATVSITVNAVNDAPVAANNSYSTNEDVALTVPAPGVLANDTDVEGTTLTAALVSGPLNGTLTLNADGSFTYTPAANFNGGDTFSYRASDGSLTADAVVSITVNSINDQPVVNAGPDLAVTLPAGASLAGTAADIDTPGLIVTWSKVSGPGTVTFGNPSAAATTATFSTAGSYVLALNANDGEFDLSDTTTVVVSGGNNAVRFDGANDYVTFGPAAGPSGLGASVFTIETWFRRDGPGVSTTTGTNGVPAMLPLVTKGAAQAEGSNVDANYILGIDATRRVIAADFEDTATGGNHPVYGTTIICEGIWYHAAATYDGTTWRLYLNGVLETQFNVGSFTPRSDSIQHAGLATTLTSTGTAAGFFQGAIDEARIWNVVRSQAQIQAALGGPLVTPVGGLLARWALDETSGTSVADSSGRGINGTMTNGPLSVAGGTFEPSLPVGGAYGIDFTGTTAAADYVSFGPAPALGLSTFTVETWFKREGTGVTANTGTGGVDAIPLVTKGRGEAENSPVDMNYFLGIRGSDNVLVADFEEGPSAGGTPGLNHPIAGTTAIQNNVWYHAAVSYDGTTLRLYLNGIQERSLAVGRPTRSDSIQHAALGTALNSTGVAQGFFNGALDETRIWNHARSTSQILDNKGLEIPSSTGLVGRWSFNTGCGHVIDSSGSNITATLFGTGWTWTSGALVAGSGGNTAPSVNAGADQTVTLSGPVTVTLNGVVGDDGLPGGSVTTQWTKVSGPGTVTFDNASQASTTATFTVAGTYVLQLAANDGALSSSDTLTVIVSAISGTGGLDLGGTNAYATFGVAPGLGASTLTIETWFRRTGAGVATNTGSGGVVAIPLVTKGMAEVEGGTVDMNYFLGIRQSDGVLIADFEDTATGANHPVMGVTPIPADGVWRHAAATYDGTTWRLYLNGVLDVQLVVGSFTPRFDSIQHAVLGSALNSTGGVGSQTQGFFAGTLDEARIWNYARSGQQVSRGMQLEVATAPGLLGRWSFSEGTGTTIADSSGQAITGTIVGTNWSWAAGAPFTPPGNSAPVAASDTANTNLNTAVTIGVLANDTDADGDALTVTNVTAPANGTAVANPNGTVGYTPANGYQGSDNFNYTINDNQGGSAIGSVSVTVAGIANQPPVVNAGLDQTITLPVNVATLNGVVTDDGQPGSGLTIQWSKVSGPGVVTFTNAAVASTTATFSVQGTYALQLSGNDGALSTTDSVSVTVNPNAGNKALQMGGTNAYVTFGAAPGLGASQFTLETWFRRDGAGVATNTGSGGVMAIPLVTKGMAETEGGPVDMNYFLGIRQSDGVLVADFEDTTTGLNHPVAGTTPIPADGAWRHAAVSYDGTTWRVYLNGVLEVTLPVGNFTPRFDSIQHAALGTALNSTGGVGGIAQGFFAGVLDEARIWNHARSAQQIAHGMTLDIPTNVPGLLARWGLNEGTGTVVGDSSGNARTGTIVGTNWSWVSGAPFLASGNAAPVALNDTATTTEGAATTIAVLPNDTDADGDPLVVTTVSTPANGTASLNPNGTVTYTPAAAFSGSDAFSYSISDTQGGTATGNVNVTVTNINDPPVAVNDSYSVDKNSVLMVDVPGVLANDTDPDLDVLMAIGLSAPANGTLTFNADGDFIYTPNAGYVGVDSFTYIANDGTADSNVATVTITVNAVNEPPAAVNDAYSIDEDNTLNVAVSGVLGNDTDPNSNPLTAIVVSQPANGTLTFNANGSFSYAPAANYNGPDSFTYKASDGTLDSNVATVTLTVNAVNDAPVTVNDSYSTSEDTALNVGAPGVLANDTDLENNPLTAVLVSGPTNGALTLNGDGSFTYTPAANYNGPDSFTYRATDGADSNVATVSITVSGAPDAPTAVNDSYSVAEDAVLSVASPGVLGNDLDADGDALTAIVVSGPSNGTLTLNANGSLSYTPVAGYSGADGFTYKANDGTADSNVATVSIAVTPVNDAPVAVADAYSTNEDVVLTVAAQGVLGNDSDVDGDSLSAVLVSNPSNGSLTLASDGSFSYTPAANYNGPDSFTYRANDGAANSNIATVSITVDAVNDPPTAVGENFNLNEDSTVVLIAPGVLFNDTDSENDGLTAILVSGPSNGTLTLYPDGGASYMPAADFNGTDSFTYKANDGTLDSNVATVAFTIAPQPDAPVANDNSYVTNEDTTLVMVGPGVLGNDTDVDGNSLTAIQVTGPGNGTLTLNANGGFSYTPAVNYNGPDSFTYKANDGTADSNVATVSLTVSPVNDAPVAVNNSFSTNEDTPLMVAVPGVIGNDTDADGNPLTSILVSGTSQGTLSLNADGSFTYTPAANYSGSDSFTYRATDGVANSNVATVTLTVNAVNDAPVAMGESYSTDEDTPLVINAPGLLANDSDAENSPLTAVKLTNPSRGTVTVNANGSFTYTPTTNLNGPDSFTYRVNDGNLNSNTVTVSITVNPVNDAPVALNQARSVNEDALRSITLTGSDVDGNPLTFTIVTPPANGVLTGTPPLVVYDSNPNYNGPDSFTFRVNDGTVNSANVGTVTLTVTPVNDAPVAQAASFTTPVNTPRSGNLIASDVDGDPLTYTVTTAPTKGSLIVNSSTGAYTYTPFAGRTGADFFRFRVNDGTTNSPIVRVDITITP